MMIHNINEFATAFDTTWKRIEYTLSNLAHMDLTVDNTLLGIRISHFIGECNADVSCTFKYPFDSMAVTTFINSLEPMVADMYDIYDDPFDMLLNTTNPCEDWTIEDAGKCLSEAEACGWKFPNYVTPQFILDLYNDMSPEEGDE